MAICTLHQARGKLADFPEHFVARVQSNVLCVAALPSLRLAAVGSADGMLRVVHYDKGLLREIRAASSGLLALSLAPGLDGRPTPLLAAGCMDGSLVVLDIETGLLLGSSKPHAKYVVAVQWTGDGEHLVTGSWDCTWAVHRWQQHRRRGTPTGAPGGAAPEAAAAPPTHTGLPAAEGGGGSTAAGAGWELALAHREQCTGQATAVLALPGLSSFMVAVRGSNYLRQYSIASKGSSSGQQQGGSVAQQEGGSITQQQGSISWPGGDCRAASPAVQVKEERRLNMNATGDDHVSFAAAHLTLSACGEYLLVSADNGRLITYALTGGFLFLSLCVSPAIGQHPPCVG